MKRIGDLIALFYILVLVFLLVFFKDKFIYLTKTYPYWMGFLKVALLATFGECLKMRMTKKQLENYQAVGQIFCMGIIWHLVYCCFSCIQLCC